MRLSVSLTVRVSNEVMKRYGIMCATDFVLNCNFVICANQWTMEYHVISHKYAPWWRHQTFSALLAICAGNSLVPGEFPAQRPVTRSFDVFFDLRLNEQLSKQSWGWWFETPSRSLWRHCNVQFCCAVFRSGYITFLWTSSIFYQHLSGVSHIARHGGNSTIWPVKQPRVV